MSSAGIHAADTELVAWLIEQHLTMSTVAQSRDLSDRKTIENFAAVVQSVEQMKSLTILTTADIRGVGPGVWATAGRRSSLRNVVLRKRAGRRPADFRKSIARSGFRWRRLNPPMAFTEWPEQELNAYIARHYPAYWLKVEYVAQDLRHARFLRGSEQAGVNRAINVGFDEARRRHRTERSSATDHPWLLLGSSPAPAPRRAPTSWTFRSHHHPIGPSTPSRSSREYDRDEDEGRRATPGIGEMIEDVLEGKLRLPEVVARRAASRKARPFRGRAKSDHQQPVVGPLHRN